MNILASTNYFLDAVKPGRSGNKEMASTVAKLDSMIDMEKDGEAVSAKAEASKLKIDGVSKFHLSFFFFHD